MSSLSYSIEYEELDGKIFINDDIFFDINDKFNLSKSFIIY